MYICTYNLCYIKWKQNQPAKNADTEIRFYQVWESLNVDRISKLPISCIKKKFLSISQKSFKMYYITYLDLTDSMLVLASSMCCNPERTSSSCCCKAAFNWPSDNSFDIEGEKSFFKSRNYKINYVINEFLYIQMFYIKYTTLLLINFRR